jgi:chemotaxis protein MotB
MVYNVCEEKIRFIGEFDMKKALLVSAFLITFVLGVVLSEFILQGLNSLLGTGIQTKKELNEEKVQAEKAKDAIQQQYDDLSAKVDKKQADLDNLIKDIDTKVNSTLVKDILLTTPSTETGDKGQIFLNPQGTESLLKPTASDDPTVEAFKNTFNKKAKEILDVSKGIMGEKIGRLNKELLRINDELKDTNVELIGKLRAEEKYKKQIGDLNEDLQSANEELTGKNEELNNKLKEVEQYKKELDQHKKYINDLEGIKSDLEKTVGVLETKIEDGRLKVSFEGDILFESGKHYLKEEGKKLLERVFPILIKNVENNDIFIAGHTDNVPIREDARDRYESNWNLSTYRAIEVVKYLVEKGMSPRSMTAAGYGEFKPVADNSTPEGKAKNRRVELFLIPKIIKRNLNK